jgi:hypothetical protein
MIWVNNIRKSVNTKQFGNQGGIPRAVSRSMLDGSNSSILGNALVTIARSSSVDKSMQRLSETCGVSKARPSDEIRSGDPPSIGEPWRTNVFTPVLTRRNRFESLAFKIVLTASDTK